MATSPGSLNGYRQEALGGCGELVDLLLTEHTNGGAIEGPARLLHPGVVFPELK